MCAHVFAAVQPMSKPLTEPRGTGFSPSAVLLTAPAKALEGQITNRPGRQDIQ